MSAFDHFYGKNKVDFAPSRAKKAVLF